MALLVSFLNNEIPWFLAAFAMDFTGPLVIPAAAPNAAPISVPYATEAHAALVEGEPFIFIFATSPAKPPAAPANVYAPKTTAAEPPVTAIASTAAPEIAPEIAPLTISPFSSAPLAPLKYEVAPEIAAPTTAPMTVLIIVPEESAFDTGEFRQYENKFLSDMLPAVTIT